MTSAITHAGYEGRVGILVDAAAGCYYDDEKSKFVGLFSREEKSREELFDEYLEMVSTYPFIVLEDPLDEKDLEGHALLTKKLGIEVVGDDLFASNIKRLQEGIKVGACNAMLLRVNLVGTISEVADIVQLAYRSGYGVMPCSSRGEGVDTVDYAVGLATGHMKGGGSNESELATRLLKVEEELGNCARFLGKEGLISKGLSRPLQTKEFARTWQGTSIM